MQVRSNTSQGVVGANTFNVQDQGALQTTNRAANNKRVLKLRKELSGVSSGFNQSRSASQGRAALAGNSSAQALNQLVGEPHKTKNNLN